MKKDLKTAKNASLFNGQVSKSPEEFFHLEVKLTDHEKAVVEMLKLVADDSWKTTEKFLNTVGDLYPMIREKFQKQLHLTESEPENELKTEKNQKKKKADVIREKNVIEKVNDSIFVLEKLIEQKMWKSPPSVHSDLIETRLLAMMYHLAEMTKDVENQSTERQYDLVFGASKMLSKLKSLQVKHKHNGQVIEMDKSLIINDFEKLYQRYLEKCEFDILEASLSYPKLFIKTSYDHILPGMSMSPYVSQLEVMDLLKNNKKNGCLLWLNTLTGEGKTSLVISISKWALNMRTYRDKDLSKPEVIYCCSEKLKAIRQQVGQYAWNAALPFGIAEMDHTVDHPSYCKNETPRILTISDIKTTIYLLKENKKRPEKDRKQYILFFDEPTFTLDQENSEMIGYLSELFHVMPKQTILSTATAPEKDKIPRLEEIFKEMYPGSLFHFVKSIRVQIGSEISDFSGVLYLPHSGCQTYEQYKNVVDKISTNGFLQKCYTANIVNGMYTMLTRLAKKYKFSVDVDFKTYMGDTSNMNQQAIQRLGWMYLTNLCRVCDEYQTIEQKDELVKAFCKVTYKKESIDFDKLCTEYGIFENQTLIVTSNPVSFFDRYFSNYLQMIETELGKSFADLYKEYVKNTELFEKEKQTKLEEFEKANKSASVDEKERMLCEKIQELEMYRPRLNFNEKYIIGSRAYYKNEDKKNDPEDEERKKRRDYSPVTHLDLDSLSCQDKHQLGLSIGVGILSNEMSPSYLRKVSELALKGLLAYVIADDDICYGTNYPIENVIVDECMDSHSVKTIFQVFARAGRPGKSWKATIYAHSTILEKIRQYVFNDGYVDIETNHMNKALEMCQAVDKVEKVENVVKENSTNSTHKDIRHKVIEKEEVCESWEDAI